MASIIIPGGNQSPVVNSAANRGWQHLDNARRLSAVAAVYAVIAGVVSLAGWFWGIERLADWWGTGITIKPNTCFAMVLSGIALCFTVFQFAPRRSSAICAISVALIGGATLFEHLTNIDLRIDTLLFDEPANAIATAAPGRMGPPASISFMAIGIALLLLRGGVAAQKFAIGLATLVMCIGTLSLTGYLYRAEPMYTMPDLTGIAMQTAIVLLVLGIGVITAAPQREPAKTFFDDSNGGILARRIMPTAVLVPLALGWFRLEGSHAGLYGEEFGTALRTLAEMLILGIVLWWCIQAIRLREQRQHEAERQHQLSEHRSALILENLADGFVTLDANCRFTYVNARAEAIFEIDRSKLINRVVWDLFPHVVGSPLHSEIVRVAREQVTSEIDSAGTGGSGHRYFRNRIYPSTEGGVSIYVQDVTARVEAEKALRMADQQKDEFLATLAHELRNPLAPISNAAALLTAPGATAATLHSSAEIIGRQVKHMARLLEDLLDISRISRNRLELRKERVALAQIIEAAIESTRPAIDAAQHELIVALPAESIYLDGDLTRLAQVFSNVLNNAAKYTPRRGIIAITASVEHDSVVVSISDNGIGIDAAALPHIFDMFTQASPGSPNSSDGLGIGLALASRIAKHHGGSIEAQSGGKGRGSEFIVRLPVLEAEPYVAKKAFEDTSAIAQQLRLLVVDDQRDSADTLARLLQALGHEVRTTYTGQGALSEAEAFQPDAIFLDIGLPDIDGIEVCLRLRANELMRDMFVVAMTGWGQAEDKQQTQQAGFNVHLIKPASADDLMKLLAEISARKIVREPRAQML